LSKIGAEPAQHVLSRVSVVNSQGFHHLPVRSCDTPMPVQRCGNHCEDAVRACARAGLDIAKPIVEIVDPVGEWIADVTFSTKTLFARSGPHASCSF
jgi:hypothetical protein